MNNKVIAGIVTFNPDIKRLSENLDALENERVKILIVDNGSKNIEDIQALSCNYECIEVLSLPENRGIAYGLLKIMEYAKDNRYLWVLTLDQDSIVCDGLIENYMKYSGEKDVGAMTCIINDRNYPEINGDVIIEARNVDACITSGCFMNVEAYTHTHGYREDMFIDFVDFDICYQLRKMEYCILQVPFEGLIHEYGRGKKVAFMGKKLYITNHPLWRKYYMAKNFCVLRHNFPEYISCTNNIKFELIMFVKSIFFEKDKISSIKMIIKGICDGLRYK